LIVCLVVLTFNSCKKENRINRKLDEGKWTSEKDKQFNYWLSDNTKTLLVFKSSAKAGGTGVIYEYNLLEGIQTDIDFNYKLSKEELTIDFVYPDDTMKSNYFDNYKFKMHETFTISEILKKKDKTTKRYKYMILENSNSEKMEFFK